MANLLRYYVVIIVLSGLVLSENQHRRGIYFSIGQSDLAIQMSDLNTEEISSVNTSNNYLLSLGYNRLDIKGVRSGFGIEYIAGNNLENNNISSAYWDDWFGIGLLSFFQYPIFKYKSINFFELGARARYDLGLSNSNFSLGPLIGISLEFNSLGININYFRGCLDFVKFEKFSEHFNIEIYFIK